MSQPPKTMKPEARAQASKIGERLARLRLRAGLTQEQLAVKAGVAAKTISAYERGQRNPSAKALARLLAVLKPRRRDVAGELLRLGEDGPLSPTTRQIAELAEAQSQPVRRMILALARACVRELKR